MKTTTVETTTTTTTKHAITTFDSKLNFDLIDVGSLDPVGTQSPDVQVPVVGVNNASSDISHLHDYRTNALIY